MKSTKFRSWNKTDTEIRRTMKTAMVKMVQRNTKWKRFVEMMKTMKKLINL